jgi:antitoxin component of MazEF toxin-antitoxin module
MKYIQKRKTKLYFHRGIPTRLRSISGKSDFSRPLRLDAATATEQQILEARIEAQRMYDLYLKTLENTSADAYADNEIEALAADVLRRNKATAGQYAPHMLGSKLQENDPVLKRIPWEIKQEEYAAMSVPEHTELMIKLHEEGSLKTALNDDQELVHTPTRKLTAQEEAVQRAWEAVQKVNNQAPRTITSLWQAYLTQNRRFDLDNPLNR